MSSVSGNMFKIRYEDSRKYSKLLQLSTKQTLVIVGYILLLNKMSLLTSYNLVLVPSMFKLI